MSGARGRFQGPVFADRFRQDAKRGSKKKRGNNQSDRRLPDDGEILYQSEAIKTTVLPMARCL